MLLKVVRAAFSTAGAVGLVDVALCTAFVFQSCFAFCKTFSASFKYCHISNTVVQ